MRPRSKPFRRRLFLWIVGGPPREDVDDRQVEVLRFLRRFFLRAYMPFSLAYVAVAATFDSAYWVPAIAVLVIGTASVVFLSFRIRHADHSKH